MIIEETEGNHISDHILDWLDDSVSFLPSFLDDSYCYQPTDVHSYQQWWNPTENICQDPTHLNTNLTTITPATAAATTTTAINGLIQETNPTIAHHPQQLNSPRIREAADGILQNHQERKKQDHQTVSNEEKDGEVVAVVTGKRSNGTKRSNSKNTGNNSNNGNNKEGRWAEHLLNPCAIAINTGNLSRVQHLLYVLHELASSTGDANHRLAFYGLRALTHHLSSSLSSATSSSSSSSSLPMSFASTEPKFFQRSLLKFYEVSPWFAFPNNIANSSILQILTEEQDHKHGLHIIDIGVSHGVQWPTLLEALTRRLGGPPPLVRITVITASIENDQNSETPFSVGPPGDNFSSRLLSFAKSMNINLQINRLDCPLKYLNAVINTNSEEILIVCAQFRVHHLNHTNPDERTEFLKFLKDLEPKGVILSENNTDCSCHSCEDFATGFSRRVDYLWKFLDSTSTAFKGRESNERRVMEGEAAKALTNRGEMNEGKEKWCERMRSVGFVGEIFGEDAIDGGRALLRKYDSNWEMRVEEKDGCVGLWWKGQPVSFCSLWKLDVKGNEC